MTALMVDMEQTLEQFQQAFLAGLPVHKCETHEDMVVHRDQPNDVVRYTYAITKQEQVIAISAFCQVDHFKGLPCFNVGYAVKETERNKGFGTDILEKGITELKHGLSKAGVKDFYIEAGVEKDNIASQKIATKVLKVSPVDSVDPDSGTPTYGFISKQTDT